MTCTVCGREITEDNEGRFEDVCDVCESRYDEGEEPDIACTD
jgi:CRISPR/Cas system-associated protein Cas10 (large subunit of type III CRISPR-Cas system)